MEKFPSMPQIRNAKSTLECYTQAHKNQTPLYFHPSLFLLCNKYLSTHLVHPHRR